MPVSKTYAGNQRYGHEDLSYQTADCLDGQIKLVDEFYRNMETQSFAKKILAKHHADMAIFREKLVYLLSGWLGGTRLYSDKYGAINILKSHGHLGIDEDDKNAWLRGMALAIEKQPYLKEFAAYLLAQLNLLASRIEQVCRRS